MHTSGVTNGFEHSALPAKLKIREERRKSERKRKGRKGERKETGTRNKKKRKEKEKRKLEKGRRKILCLFSTRLIFFKVNYYMKKSDYDNSRLISYDEPVIHTFTVLNPTYI